MILRLVLCFIVMLTTNAPLGAQERKAAQYHVTKVTDNAYVITQIWQGHNNGNMGVVIGESSVLLVNTLMTNTAEQLHRQIKKLTEKPIKYVINSDTDPYNHHANKYFAEQGATIFSHENFKYAKSYHQVLFTDQLSLNLGNETVIAYHTPAHTFNHVLIQLKNANMIFTADAFKAHWIAPTGANGIEGYNKAIDQVLSLSDENTVIVTGNTSKIPARFVVDRNILFKAKTIQNNFASRVGELYKQGLSIAQITQDERLQQILQPLEKFNDFYQYIDGAIKEVIETSFSSEFNLSPHQLSQYVGKYQLNENSTMEVKLINKRLYIMEPGRYLFELLPLSRTRFDIKANIDIDHLVFSFDAHGKVAGAEAVMGEKSWWRLALPPGKRIKL